jgi:hypothetical protein
MKGVAMNIKLGRAGIRLESRQIVQLLDPAGTRVQCVCGVLWITQEGDGRDHIVAPGQSLTLDYPGLALVHALEPSDLEILPPVPAQTGLQRLVHALAGALRSGGKWAADVLSHTFGPAALEAYRPGKWHQYL